MLRILVITLLVVINVFLQDSIAQESCTFELSGYVLDAHNKQPLPSSKVHIRDLDITAIADSNGFYSIPNICAGTYLVFCKHVGCPAIKDTVIIKKSLKLNFYPEHHIELDHVIIQEDRDKNKSLKPNRLNERELNESRGGSLGEGLAKINGVRQLTTGNNISKPVIHGMHSNRILILNNGVRQEGQQWGNEHAPAIDPFIADELAVVKGANSVRYGPDAIAGVILVNPKPLKDTPGISGELNLVGFTNGREGNASATLEGNANKIQAFRWRVQGSLKRGGNVQSPDYYLRNTGVKEYNFSGAAGYVKKNYGVEVFYSQFNTRVGIFSAAHFGNLADLQKAFDADRPLESADFTYDIGRPFQHIEHELFKVSGYLRTGEKGKISATYARQFNRRKEYDKHLPLNDSLANLNLPALQFNLTTHTGEISWDHIRIKNFKGSIGINGLYQGNTYSGRFFIPNFRKVGGGVFLIEQWKPEHSKFAVEFGARFDHVFQRIYMWQDDVIISPFEHFNNASGTLGLAYAFSKKANLRFNAGTAWRPPNVNELYSDGLHHGAAAIEVGDSSLTTEKALNFTSSFQYTSKKFNLLIDAYCNVINDFIYLKPTLQNTLTIKGAFPVFAYDQVDASLVGTDITGSYNITESLQFTSKASILRARNRSERAWLVMMPADRFENRLEYNFKDGARIKNAYIAISVETVLEQTRVPENSDFAPPPEGYTLLNASASMDVPIRNQAITLGVSANNILNVRYRDYLNRFRYFADEMGTNVAFRVKVPFNLVIPKSIHK
jgi:iron complex outermembrane receptor protein